MVHPFPHQPDAGVPRSEDGDAPQSAATRPAPRPGGPGQPPDTRPPDPQVTEDGAPEGHRGPADATEPPAEAGDEPRPLGLTVSPTGDAAVDAGLRRLADADHLPVSEHLTVYEDVHRRLRETLGALDGRPGPHPPAPHDTGS